jgi:hypothetical protein
MGAHPGGYRFSVPAVKWPEHGAEHSPLFCVEAETVEVFVSVPFVPSWRREGIPFMSILCRYCVSVEIRLGYTPGADSRKLIGRLRYLSACGVPSVVNTLLCRVLPVVFSEHQVSVLYLDLRKCFGVRITQIVKSKWTLYYFVEKFTEHGMSCCSETNR